METDFEKLMARGEALMSRLGVSSDELRSLHPGPFHGYLVLIPLLEVIVDRLDLLEANKPE